MECVMDSENEKQLEIKNAVISDANQQKEVVATLAGSTNIKGGLAYADSIRMNAKQGHGFAAEQTNNVDDCLAGKDAKIVGNDNALNGPDRVVNGTAIQTKYCKTPRECVEAFFDNGNWKYRNQDGSMMVGEVPKGFGQEAEEILRNKIKNGECYGIKDPNKAKALIREGSVTYEQSVNIAKFGTIDGLIYDAKRGIVAVSESVPFLGIGAALVFCKSLWDGKSFNESVMNASIVTLKIGGFIALQTAIASEIAKTGLDDVIKNTGVSQKLVKLMGPDLSKKIFPVNPKVANAAVVEEASKILRGNLITMSISVSILSVKDFFNFFSGDISFQQLTKNVLLTTSGVAGAAIGAAIGSAFAPGIGSVVGGFVGGSVASKRAKRILDEMIEDDAKTMLNILQNVWADLSYDYMLSESEAALAMAEFKKYTDARPDFIKDIFRNPNHREEAEMIVKPIVEAVAATRPKISLPQGEDFVTKFAQVTSKLISGESVESFNVADVEEKTKKKTLTNFEHEVAKESVKIQIASIIVMTFVCALLHFFEWHNLHAVARHLFFFIPCFVVAAAISEMEENKTTANIPFLNFSIGAQISFAGLVFFWGPIGTLLAFFGFINWLTFWDFGFTILVLSFPFTIATIVLGLRYVSYKVVESREEKIARLVIEFREKKFDEIFGALI